MYFKMPEDELKHIIRSLHHLKSNQLDQALHYLSEAKLILLRLKALIPTSSTPPALVELAKEVFEIGAFISIRLRDTESFKRYYQQLQPFYALQSTRPQQNGNQSKITGLYLLLLLSIGDYAGFHTELETLQTSPHGKQQVETDECIQYPVRLEQALQEGSYDKVWGETKGERVPSEEFEIFSDVLINTIRDEIASCSERAYPSLPISNAKNLLYLDSEGSVLAFAKQRGWLAKDGRIYFPQQEEELRNADKDVMSASGQLIENTLGYARKLETIV